MLNLQSKNGRTMRVIEKGTNIENTPEKDHQPASGADYDHRPVCLRSADRRSGCGCRRNGAAADTQAEETVEPTAEPEPIYSETALAEMAILDAVDYSDKNFLTEAEFYDLLGQILALHDVEMTRYPGTMPIFITTIPTPRA